MEQQQSANKIIDSRDLYIGDDTGLIKKAKLSMQIQEDIISMPNKPKRRKNKRNHDEIEEENKDQDESNLFDDENLPVIKKRPEISLKATNKYGNQIKDEGIKYMSWSLGNSNNDYISYVRGKSNIVQVFDTQTENVFKEKQYSDLKQIKGVVPIAKDIFDLKHIIVDEKGTLIVSNCNKGKEEANIQVNGNNISCLSQNPFLQSQVAIGAKDTLLQTYDISKLESKKPLWQARNLPNDELDLQIPIWDTDIAYITSNQLCTCTAYGYVRHYDFKAQRRPVINAKLTIEDMYLGKIAKSLVDENIIFVSNQEGNVIMVDKRKNYKVVRKFLGSRGSIRDVKTFVSKCDNKEYLLVGGCDRNVRVFDLQSESQKGAEIGHIYLKQKLNSILVSQCQQ